MWNVLLSNYSQQLFKETTLPIPAFIKIYSFFEVWKPNKIISEENAVKLKNNYEETLLMKIILMFEFKQIATFEIITKFN